MFPLLFIAALTCGNERWDVKTLTDKDAAKVDLVNMTESVNFPTLLEMKVPYTKWSNSLPRAKLERMTWSITADVIAFKVEDDRDIHIVLADHRNHKLTMVAEIPDPACMKNSPVKAQVTAVRANFQKIFGPLPKTVGKLHTLKEAIPVVIQGVVFFDKLHGQTGVAPNGVELHPVLGIEQNVPDKGT
jgi:hypothetical protein